VEVLDTHPETFPDRVQAATRPRYRARRRPQLLVTDAGTDTLSFIDPQSFLERDRLAVGRGPAGILIDGMGMRAYVFNSLASSITIVDIPNRSVAGLIATEPGPFRGQFDRQGSRLYVISEHSPYLSVLDPTGSGVPKRVFVGGEPGALKVDTATDMIYVSKRRGIGVEIYDPFSFPAERSRRRPGSPSGDRRRGEQSVPPDAGAPGTGCGEHEQQERGVQDRYRREPVRRRRHRRAIGREPHAGWNGKGGSE
jgi:hypothetical protein